MHRSDRPVEDKNIGALLGLSLHEAIERKYRNGDDPIQVFQNTMLSTLDEWEEKNLKVNGTEWFSKSLKEGKLILKGFDWERFDPTDLELEFMLPFPSKQAPIAKINGYIDMITTNGLVVDHKSQRRAPTQDQLNHDPQFILYAWAYRELYGALPTGVIWNHLRTHKLIRADVITEFEFKLSQLIYDINAMLNAEFYPRRQMDTVCTNECSFYELCYGRRAKDIEIPLEDEE